MVRQFETMGVWSLNESVAIGRSRDKLRSTQLLAGIGIGLPVTAFAHDPKETEEVIELVGGAPVVIKLLEGTQGIGVVLAETNKSAKSIIEAFRGANVNILVQEFIKEAGGTDIRALVIGGKVVAAMQRKGAEDDFRSNLHRGGSAKPIKMRPDWRITSNTCCLKARRITKRFPNCCKTAAQVLTARLGSTARTITKLCRPATKTSNSPCVWKPTGWSTAM